MSWLSQALMGVFGKDSNTDTGVTSTTTRNPWGPAIPFLNNALQSGQDIFNQYSTPSPGEQSAAGQQASVLGLRQNAPAYGLAASQAQNILGGGADPNLVQMHSVAAPTVGYDMGTANPAKARATQGVLDPTTALMQQLSGQSNNPYLHQMASAATQQQQQSYQDQADDANQNLTQSVLPAIRSGAVMAGGYGGSRQGIAEGTAIGNVAKVNARNARDLGQSAGGYYANLAGNDYEAAQQRQAQTADALNAQAEQAKQFDATNALNARSQNANFDLKAQEDTLAQNNTNNSQALQQAALLPQLYQGGLNLFNTATGATDNNYDQLMSVLGLPRSIAQQSYANYVNPLIGIAGLGGTTDLQSNSHTNSTARGSAFDIASQLAAMVH